MGAYLTVRVGAEWINSWYNDSCQQNNLSYRDDHAQRFCNTMVSLGHQKVFEWGNENAWERDFRHPNFGGDSLNWLDNVHFCFYSDHGGNKNDTMSLNFSRAMDRCKSLSSEWRLGGKSLKWLVLDCCNCVVTTDKAHVSAVWGPPAAGVHMIFGFVQLGHENWWNADLGEEFASEAGSGHRLKDAWLDTAYSWWLDDNPIVLAYGATQAEAKNRLDNETINWRDYPVTPYWIAYSHRS